MNNSEEFSTDTQNAHQNSPDTSTALEQCQLQLNDLKNKYLHLIADFENGKKRQERERVQWTRLAQVEVLFPLLSIIDDFERALTQKKETSTSELTSWLQGLELIHKELLKYLATVNVQEITVSEGDELNLELHESVMSTQSDIPSGHITAVLQKGYMFKGQVLRPAKVSIAL